MFNYYTMGFKRQSRSWKTRLLLRLVLILGLSLAASGCDTNKSLGQIFGVTGHILDGLGYHQKALAAFNLALEYDPDEAGAYAGRGLAHFYLDHLDEAIADYDRALSLDPEQAGTYLNRGYAYFKKGRYDQALVDYNRAIALNPADALFYNNRGEAYRLKGLPDRAMADYNRALELDSELAMAYNNRGLIYLGKGQLDQTLAEYNRSLLANPNYALAYNNRARLYYQMKQYDLAWQDVQKVQNLRWQMDSRFMENLQQALARKNQGPGGKTAEKEAAKREKKAQLSLTLNRVLGYAGLALWGYFLVYYLIWEALGRRLLKRPVKIPAEFGLERKEEYLAKRRATTQTALKQLERFSKVMSFPIIISCLVLSIMGTFDWVSSQHFSFESLFLAGVLIPAYLSMSLTNKTIKDSLQQLDGGECILQTRTWSAGIPFWFLNLLPPLALIPLFSQVPWQDLVRGLGFGLGVVLAMILLAFVFIRAKATVGLGVNLILLNFVYLAYHLPVVDKMEKLKDLPFRDFFLLAIFPLVVFFSALFLVSYTLVKKRGVSVSSQYFKLSFSGGVPIFLIFLASVVGTLVQKQKIMPFSWGFVGAQALAWLAMLISLVLKDYRQKVDFQEIRDYIVNEKGLRIRLNRGKLLLYLALFLAVCTFCETFRGLWGLWAASALWIILILAYLWKVWRYALVEP